ncbi:LLM class flavin-dependent oxidoreductase [uncultured Microbacterium sp.]|uniref:LLM class flavin-dependent oxidoreductase n=1 Tax=uncultured Microbacterium sp. TaxID=191216 RepID=UPI002608AFE1|nr:LLM class flavin-dependent oxidoreductase [uncultured Microbacterium sp.]
MGINLGYWTPVYGGFLRNVTDEGRMAATWEHIREVSVKADRLGFHTTLVPELYLNDRKGVEAPSLEAWSLSAAILAVTDHLRVMTAVRPGFHLPAVLAKTVSTLDTIAPGRIALNVVAAWWAEEARQFGGDFPAHDARYDQAREFVEVLEGLWSSTPFSYAGEHYRLEGTIVEPKPSAAPIVFAGGESDAGREAIANFAGAYVMHGGTLDEARRNVADMNARSERIHGRPIAEFGMPAYVIVRDTEAEALRELERITTVDQNSPGYASFEQFRANSHLSLEVSRREYSVGTRGLRPNLVGTAEQVAERIAEYADAGIDLLLIQASPLDEELDRIAEQVFPLVPQEALSSALR